MVLTFSILVALAQAPAPAVVKPLKDPLLRRGAALFDALDFDNARAAYERALTVRLGSVDEVVEAWLGVGLCDATLGDDEKAKQAFLKALAIKPDAQLEGADISPRQRAPFDAARAEARGRPAIRVDHVPPRMLPGAPATLVIKIDSDWQQLVAGARLVFRREGQAWEEVAENGASPFTLTMPPLGAGAVEYYVQAIDARGSPVALWRSPEAPHRLKLNEPGAEDGTAFYKRPWLWIAIGGAVVAGVAAGVIATQTQAPDYSVTTRHGP
jgi:tetratricopeptide (TPR) repeat protein